MRSYRIGRGKHGFKLRHKHIEIQHALIVHGQVHSRAKTRRNIQNGKDDYHIKQYRQHIRFLLFQCFNPLLSLSFSFGAVGAAGCFFSEL